MNYWVQFKEFTFWDLGDKLRYYLNWCKEPTGIFRFLEFFERIPFINLVIMFIKPFYLLFEYVFKLYISIIMIALIFSPFFVPFVFSIYGFKHIIKNEIIHYGIAVVITFLVGVLIYYIKGLYRSSKAEFKGIRWLYFIILMLLTCGLPTFFGFVGIYKSLEGSTIAIYWQYGIILVTTLLSGTVAYLFYEPNKGTSPIIFSWAFNLGYNKSFS